MALKKNIGKNTLGDGKKMQVDLRTYNRSTHDLSFAWRNTQGVGTLVPCFKQLALPGDTFDIDIDAKVLTHPTVGPLFGSYKLQVDFFVAPIRLYNAMLHNNALNIGLDMSKVKLPKIRIPMTQLTVPSEENQFSQIHPSCVLAYLGNRGWGISTDNPNDAFRNAVPLLSYLDIFKNYYANKQEEEYYWLGQPTIGFNASITQELEYTVADKPDGTLGRYISGGVIDITVDNETDGNKLGFFFRNIRKGGEEVTLSSEEMKEFTSYTFTSGHAVYSFNAQGKPKLFDLIFVQVVTYPKITIESAKLEELDDLRESILAAGSTQFNVSPTSKQMYFKSLLGFSTKLNSSLPNAGLLLKTHQSDVFTNWINTEWIDGENGISAITAISTAGDEFTIDSLNLAKKVYDMLNRIAVSGGSYRDWIETVYTSDYTIHAETPIYEGGMSDEIVFQEVVSNSATEDEPLGTLAGRGTLAGNRKGGKLHIKINEPSYIIGICSITPRVDYCQGNDWDVYLDTMNDLHKPQLDGIGYQDLPLSQCVWWKGNKESYGKTVAWVNYMTNFNKTYGNFAIEGNEAFMVLNRYFDTEGTNMSLDPINTTSYINPTDFNYTFAETSLEAQNFWVQLGFGVKARRVMSAKQIPNL